MKDKRNVLIITLAVFLIGLAIPTVCFAAAVSVECAYRNDGDPPGTPADVECHVYVDTQSAGLISGGIKLLYDTDKLDTPVVTKNETDWYFGAGTSEHAYMDPEIIESPPQGEVAFIVGKLNTNDITQVGVNSTRVLVGTATFARKTAEIRSGIQDAFFGISWDLGRTGGTYVNFVDTAGADLDGAVTLTHLKVVERGDANGDGSVNISDVTEIRNMVFNINPATVYADCNADTFVNISDVTCIRDKVFP